MTEGTCRACFAPILLTEYQVRNSVYICRPCDRARRTAANGHHKGPRPVMVRFWEKVDLSGGLRACWPWKAAIAKDGYGTFWLGDRLLSAHAAAYTLLRGPIPPGLVPDHLCHNADPTCPGGPCAHRRCVNPWHLEPVTIGVNTLRGKTLSSRNAAKTTCNAGHPYDGNVSLVNGRYRRCRICHAARVRESNARRRERGAA